MLSLGCFKMKKTSLKQAIQREWKELKEKRKKYLKDSEGSFIKKVPNFLTYVRTGFAFVIPILVYIHPFSALILAMIIASTDSFDGMIARKYDAVSEYGAFLDAFADKLLSLALFCSLFRVSILFPFLILFGEGVISFINILAEILGKKTYSSIFGKVKAWAISLSAVVGLATLSFPNLKDLSNTLFVIAIVAQWITIFHYIYIHFIKSSK